MAESCLNLLYRYLHSSLDKIRVRMLNTTHCFVDIVFRLRMKEVILMNQ